MRTKIILSIFLLFSIEVYSQDIFLKNKPTNEVASVSFKDSNPSIIFFGIKNNTESFKSHKAKANEVNKYFGSVYTALPVMDIGNGNIVEYGNKNGAFFFYKPNTKKPFGMIISNGIDKPILVTNPNLYLKTIKVYLNIGNADYLVPKTFDAQNKNAGLMDMQQLLKIKSIIQDDVYASKLIKNANTIHYSKIYNDGSSKIICTNRVYELFSDSLMKEKTPYGAKYLYNSRNEIVEFSNIVNGKEEGTTKYVRSQNHLINYMIMQNGNVADTTLFLYEKDKYHTISLKNGKATSFETFFLNNQLQCVRRLSKTADRTIWDIAYVYDKLGRVIREGKLESEMIYEYKNDADLFFSSFSSYSLNPRKLNLKNEIIREKNKQTFIGRNGTGELNIKTISYTNIDGSAKTYSYDKNNKLVSVGLLRCE